MDDNATQDIRKGLKATYLFGGVEIFGIIISLIKSKLVAILLGPSGVGMVELFSSTVRLISSMTNFSLGTSAVRDVSVAYKSGNSERTIYIVSIFRKIVWVTGLFGFLICLLGSPFWSRMTFGSFDYTLGFIMLSIVLVFQQLTIGNNVILQGTGNYRYLAYSSLLGHVAGLLTTVPIYYFFREKGIVAVLITTAIVAYLLSYIVVKKLNLKYIIVKIRETISEGREMLRQGFLLSVNFLLSTIIFYVLRVFITDKGGVAELGLYASCYVIVNTYVGLVFQAMSKEYYPRLSAVSFESSTFINTINNQIYLILLILGPMIGFFLMFTEQLLRLLYSDKFSSASMLMALSLLGVLFQAPSVCLGYAFLAKADNKIFLIWESIGKIQKLITDILCYLMWGLTGLGISFIVSYINYTLQCSIVCNRRYGYRMPGKIIKLLMLYVIVSATMLLISQIVGMNLKVVIGGLMTLSLCFYSYKKLSYYLDIVSMVKNRLKK